jgi:hypothetical protein
MNEKLEKTWKEHILVYFMVLSRHLPGQIEENHKRLRGTGNTAKIYPCASQAQVLSITTTPTTILHDCVVSNHFVMPYKFTTVKQVTFKYIYILTYAD